MGGGVRRGRGARRSDKQRLRTFDRLKLDFARGKYNRLIPPLDVWICTQFPYVLELELIHELKTSAVPGAAVQSGHRGTCQAAATALQMRDGAPAKGTLGGPHTSPEMRTHDTSWQVARCTHKATRLHVRSKLRPPHDHNLGLLAFMMRCQPDTQPPKE